MGNKCKPVSRFESKHPNRPFILLQDDKKDKKIRKRWENILKKYALYDKPFEAFFERSPEKFRRYLADGPPDYLRWEVWKAALGVSGRNVLLDTSLSEDNYSIEKDLERTFPDHPFFSSPRGIRSLRNVLVSMVNNHPELGYCQGMNSVAGVFLIISKNEEESYAMLEKLCFGYGAKGLFEYEFPLVVELCAEFHKVLKDKLPEIDGFFKDIELDDNLWITKWFMTLFSYSFHLTCVIRIWDCIFAYGLGYMVNIALGLIEFIKPELLNKTLSDMLEYLPELKEILIDIDLVLFHSVKFSVKPFDLLTPSLQTSFEEMDAQDPIRTNWEASTHSAQNSKCLIEEFSVCFSNNVSKFSM